ncbi:MAG: hypothetical protein ACKO2O_06510 [Crocinitomicaceae bacterium]
MRNKFLQRFLASILIFGLGLHASGAVQLFSVTPEKSQTSKVSSFLKKSDQIGVFDTEDLETELDSEIEDNVEKSNIYCSFDSFLIVLFYEKPFSEITSELENKHSHKLPLYIHFENYRL